MHKVSVASTQVLGSCGTVVGLLLTTFSILDLEMVNVLSLFKKQINNVG